MQHKLLSSIGPNLHSIKPLFGIHNNILDAHEILSFFDAFSPWCDIIVPWKYGFHRVIVPRSNPISWYAGSNVGGAWVPRTPYIKIDVNYGDLYFGNREKQTIEEVANYLGSGTIWNNKLAKRYGPMCRTKLENIKTLVLHCFEDPIAYNQFCLEFSRINGIGKSWIGLPTIWHNLKTETGFNGGRSHCKPHTEEAKAKMRGRFVSKQTRLAMSIAISKGIRALIEKQGFRYKKVECPTCKKKIGKNNLPRHKCSKIDT